MNASCFRFQVMLRRAQHGILTALLLLLPLIHANAANSSDAYAAKDSINQPKLMPVFDVRRSNLKLIKPERFRYYFNPKYIPNFEAYKNAVKEELNVSTEYYPEGCNERAPAESDNASVIRLRFDDSRKFDLGDAGYVEVSQFVRDESVENNDPARSSNKDSGRIQILTRETLGKLAVTAYFPGRCLKIRKFSPKEGKPIELIPTKTEFLELHAGEKSDDAPVAVGRFYEESEKHGVCTVWAAKGGYVVAAGHCLQTLLDDGRFDANGKLDDSYFSELFVRFGDKQYSLTPDYCFFNNDGRPHEPLKYGKDWAVLKIDETKQLRVGMPLLKDEDRLAFDCGILEKDTPLKIKGFDAEGEYREPEGRLNSTIKDAEDDVYLRSSIDKTESGMSGSPIFATSQSTEVVIGIHTDRDPEGGSIGTSLANRNFCNALQGTFSHPDLTCIPK